MAAPLKLISHKLFRWLTPFAMLLLFVSNLFLWSKGLFYQVALVSQAAMYAAGLLALSIDRSSVWKPMKLAGDQVDALVAFITSLKSTPTADAAR